MDLNDCIKFANENPVCYVATVDGDQPRVRAFLMWFADETGFYFHTAATKSVYKQLKANPKTEVCFYAADTPPAGGRMMRVSGKVEFLDDAELKTRLFKERPFLKMTGLKAPDKLPPVAIFRIYTGEAHFWTMEDNIKESEIEKISF